MNWSKKLLNVPVLGAITKRIASMKVNHDAMNIAEHFTQFLQPEFANTDELRDEVFRIRHNVYCEELAYEKIKDGGKEQDEFDAQSIFAMIKHKPSDTYTSCVRVVKSANETELLPIEKYCLDSIQNKELHPSNFPRHEIAEISRLAVKAEFRRRKTDKFKGSAVGTINEPTYSETELRCFPFIAIGLYMAAAAMGMETGVKHVYVMMEPRLARSMKFVGINYIQLGEAIDYHGLRAPYYINATIFMEDLSPGFKCLYKAIAKDICKNLSLVK
ncbi:PEP-CTERM/exosortase system-associated acyltransferase [Colwellia sp. MB02u-6]|jgi:N-acyl amino acid synthase of PEP-CTERM/exosortase system|uniref:PEP-CTERM/exosortase system-associated acyltransferase n=1 Tax=Colwellia sp. MB02u-6 TaxID=2759824 RepID=UPI0015F3F25C|nr:PEP-CTERM/exosortase system-associated acyltransferase [Colwellia sp. MB02u-6]MBA6328704.1 PEP-CTERM/exosortase system-associated acyltransferase [Colwellia sp. MB02u-6]